MIAIVLALLALVAVEPAHSRSKPRLNDLMICSPPEAPIQSAYLGAFLDKVVFSELGIHLSDISNYPELAIVRHCGGLTVISTVLGEFTAGRTRRVAISLYDYERILAGVTEVDAYILFVD